MVISQQFVALQTNNELISDFIRKDFNHNFLVEHRINFLPKCFVVSFYIL